MAATYSEERVRFGFLSYEDILKAIDENLLPAYSIVMAKDTHQMFLLKPDKTLLPVKTKMGVYTNVTDAETAINADESTYIGEIVSILKSDTYVAYIVNYNSSTSRYYVTEINQETVVDYDTALHTPIKNLTGTSDDPITLIDLSNGHYKVSGVMLTPDDIRVTSPAGNYVIVEDNTIKRISNSNIYDYTIGTEVTTVTYITDKYLEDNDYMTGPDVDAKIAALDFVTKSELEEYVKDNVTAIVNTVVDEKFESSQCSEKDIEDLFN